MKKHDLTKQVFAHLTVIKQSESRKGYWICKCDCGKLKEVRTTHLVRGATKSCGCHSKDWFKQNTGDKAPNWRGGITYDEYGYKLVYRPDYHRAKSNGYVREHIVIMEEVLGRKLDKGEEVHHKNGIKADNRPENLELWVKSQPPGQRVSDLVEWAKQILEKYGR